MSKVIPGAAREGGRRIEAEVFEAGERARAIVARAEEEARSIRAAAEADRDAVRSAAAALGRAEGRAEAAALVAAAARERDLRLAAVEPELVALAIDVARKVLGRALAEEPGAAVDVARQVIAAARARREVALRVHPDDAAAVRAAAPELGGLLARAALTVKEDAGLARGDAVVETEAGVVDGRIETQLALLLRALEEAAR